jgi:hypothetical protein
MSSSTRRKRHSPEQIVARLREAEALQASGQSIAGTTLGVEGGSQYALTLWVEAVAATLTDPSRLITLSVDLLGSGNFAAADTVLVSGIKTSVLIGANDANDESLHDDWVGAVVGGDNGFSHKILNFVRVQGVPNAGYEVNLDVKKPWAIQSISPISLSTTDLQITTDATGMGNASFVITGGYASARPEDVTVEASFNGQALGSQTLTVIEFSTEKNTSGFSDFPVNPGIVNSKAALVGGNLFAADTGDWQSSKVHSSDKKLSLVKPNLWASTKVKPEDIEVVWGRTIGGAGLVTSSASPNVLQVNPQNKGFPKSVPGAPGIVPGYVEDNSINDNLRMRDVGFPAASDNSTSATVVYFLGHPTESASAALAITSNHSAEIDSKPLPEGVFAAHVHIMNDATVTPPLTPSISAAEIATISAEVNALWSQAGIRFNFDTPVTTAGAADIENSATNHVDQQTTAIGNAPHSIDVYFVRSIYSGNYDAGLTVLRKDFAFPGVLVATYIPGAGAFPPTSLGLRRDAQQIARTLSHELGHYLFDNAEHDPESWQLMFKGGDGSHRFITAGEGILARGYDESHAQ